MSAKRTPGPRPWDHADLCAYLRRPEGSADEVIGAFAPWISTTEEIMDLDPMEKEAELLFGLELFKNLPPLYAPGDSIVAFTDGLGQPMTGKIILHAMDSGGVMYYIIEACDGSGNYIIPTERVSI